MKFQKLKHEVQRDLRQAYWRYVKKVITPSASDPNKFSSMKCFWKFIKHQRTEHCVVAPLKVKGKLITDPKQKAEALYDHFQAVFTRELDISNLPTPASSASWMLPIEITKSGVQKLLKHNLLYLYNMALEMHAPMRHNC